MASSLLWRVEVTGNSENKKIPCFILSFLVLKGNFVLVRKLTLIVPPSALQLWVKSPTSNSSSLHDCSRLTKLVTCPYNINVYFSWVEIPTKRFRFPICGGGGVLKNAKAGDGVVYYTLCVLLLCKCVIHSTKKITKKEFLFRLLWHLCNILCNRDCIYSHHRTIETWSDWFGDCVSGSMVWCGVSLYNKRLSPTHTTVG